MVVFHLPSDREASFEAAKRIDQSPRKGKARTQTLTSTCICRQTLAGDDNVAARSVGLVNPALDDIREETS